MQPRVVVDDGGVTSFDFDRAVTRRRAFEAAGIVWNEFFHEIRRRTREPFDHLGQTLRLLAGRRRAAEFAIAFQADILRFAVRQRRREEILLVRCEGKRQMRKHKHLPMFERIDSLRPLILGKRPRPAIDMHRTQAVADRRGTMVRGSVAHDVCPDWRIIGTNYTALSQSRPRDIAPFALGVAIVAGRAVE